MKTIVSSLMLLMLLCFNAFALDLNEYKPSTLPQTITFQHVEMERAFEEERGEVFLVEYIPAGQTLENWTFMFAVRREAFPESAVARAVLFSESLKKMNPNFKSHVFHNEEHGTALIDFLMWNEDGSIGEFNSWKFMSVGEGYLVSYQFARRGYAETPSFAELVEFMKNKDSTVHEMAAFNISDK